MASLMNITLTVTNGPNENRSCTVVKGQSRLVGRGPTADFSLIDLRMSREHFLLVGDQTGWRLRDLGSHHGTWVNQQRVEEVPLQDGDVIAAGDTGFKVSISDRPTRRQDATQAAQSSREKRAIGRRTWTGRRNQ